MEVKEKELRNGRKLTKHLRLFNVYTTVVNAERLLLKSMALLLSNFCYKKEGTECSDFPEVRVYFINERLILKVNIERNLKRWIGHNVSEIKSNYM